MKIYALCTTRSGLDALRQAAVPLAGLIGLTPREPGDAISDYVDVTPFATALGAPFIGIGSYGLTDSADRDRLGRLDIDVLLVVGWQRLVPAWLIEQVRIAVVGAHGSPWGISGGRGRSPQNWAILLRERSFSLSLFRIAPGIDDGPVLATTEFEITDTDDIADTHHKVSLLIGDMIAAVVSNPERLHLGAAQSGDMSYLPQRLPEDGANDWHRSPHDVAAFVRALARPYPGPFCRLGGGRVALWNIKPWHLRGLAAVVPGTVRARFHDGTLLVACSGGDVRVTDWEADDQASLTPGTILPSVRFQDHLLAIVDRHRTKHPHLPIAAALLARM